MVSFSVWPAGQVHAEQPDPVPEAEVQVWPSQDGFFLQHAHWRPALPVQRPALAERVYVVPGSGCAGLAPIMPSYFAGLRVSEVVVLHKPWVSANDWPRPKPCHPNFAKSDELLRWSQQVKSFIAWDLAQRPIGASGMLLMGISEGAEIIPSLLTAWPETRLAVLLASTGLDPWEALALQWQAEGQPAWRQSLLGKLADTAAPDSDKVEGRTLRYWRQLQGWRVTQPLLDSRTPTLVVMGSADAVQPPQGLRQLAATAPPDSKVCTHLITGADHGLQQGGIQHLGSVWRQVHLLLLSLLHQDFAQACATFQARN